MEFNLHMITNGTQAQINIECSSKDKIDRDKLDEYKNNSKMWKINWTDDFPR